jgi:large subunit ribosomal protein L30
MAKIIVTLKRSVNNANVKQKRTVKALGLRKIGQSVEHEVTPNILGMIRVVSHLVETCEAKGETE